ncbi:GCN5-related N-acetyltransferase [Sulfitobacter noctilucicola]|uniref:RimJ/RimL family protein N-acetyltransferase n=1 Tax=Sulfitobacter noctilucicola TaxID=1342301 RepID=A0A7W6MBK6_9RHOB|nr:GNAT family N-acetyltransferase [Sulfitobacter noctilucicola]KIN69963.1 GCN5-related N-acetyltransferase [Sulfitobacter noctilucicola]MBB4176070.1 RimJ/RimL family protein N-acetyltransferase [Sulfitobacter noctilucicola]
MSIVVPFRTTLRTGEAVLIREIGPADRPLLRDGFTKLSNQSRFFRFLAPHKALSEAELDRFAAEGTDNHFAIGAVSIGTDADMPLGTARFIRTDADPTEAEFALTIIDSHQRAGLGILMFHALAQEAQRRGVTCLHALIHSDNTGMQKLLEKFGGYRHEEATEAEWHLPLPLSSEVTASLPKGFFAIPPATAQAEAV